jgi:metal-responsive CopG/Arc/MetJ family transcriptional regulator
MPWAGAVDMAGIRVICIKISEDTLKELEEIAHEVGESRSWIIRHAIRSYINNYRKVSEESRKRAIAIKQMKIEI